MKVTSINKGRVIKGVNDSNGKFDKVVLLMQ